jgi:hypothetical protein
MVFHGVETLTINLGSGGYDLVPNDAYHNND